jgi:hypothetical protein
MSRQPVTLTPFAEATIDDVLAVHERIRQANQVGSAEALAILTQTVIQAIAATDEYVSIETEERS